MEIVSITHLLLHTHSKKREIRWPDLYDNLVELIARERQRQVAQG